MNGNGSSGGVPEPPVVRVDLKRLTLQDRVWADPDLRGSPFCRVLGEEALRALLGMGTGKRYGAGARIFVAGDAGTSLFLLLKGEARLTSGTGVTSVDVASVLKGDTMGEREALGEAAARWCSATAVREVELVEFTRDAVEAFARRRPAFGDHLRILAAERREAGAEMADFLNRW